MGKASKWFRGLFGFKRQDSPSAAAPKPPKEKRRWSFVKSYREKDHSAVNHHAPPTSGGHSSGHVESADPNLAPLAAATVVGGVSREEWAAVKIQAAFRGSLVRTIILYIILIFLLLFFFSLTKIFMYIRVGVSSCTRLF